MLFKFIFYCFCITLPKGFDENRNNLMKSKMLIQVHDELIFEVGPGELMELSMMINEIMPNAIKLDVPVLVDIKTGDSWGKLE